MTRTEVFSVTCGRNTTPDQASDGLFPGCRVVHVNTAEWVNTVTYSYLVEYPVVGSTELPAA